MEPGSHRFFLPVFKGARPGRDSELRTILFDFAEGRSRFSRVLPITIAPIGPGLKRPKRPLRPAAIAPRVLLSAPACALPHAISLFRRLTCKYAKIEISSLCKRRTEKPGQRNVFAVINLNGLSVISRESSCPLGERALSAIKGQERGSKTKFGRRLCPRLPEWLIPPRPIVWRYFFSPTI